MFYYQTLIAMLYILKQNLAYFKAIMARFMSLYNFGTRNYLSIMGSVTFKMAEL
jgi:hypothetical protein